MTPPDSGEREALCVDPVCGYLGPHRAHPPAPVVLVLIPLPLAQRILAALETPSIFGSDHRVDLARELRAAVERKT